MKNHLYTITYVDNRGECCERFYGSVEVARAVAKNLSNGGGNVLLEGGGIAEIYEQGALVA